MNEFSTCMAETEFPPDSDTQLLRGHWRLNKCEVFHPNGLFKDLKRCALHSGSVYRHLRMNPKTSPRMPDTSLVPPLVLQPSLSLAARILWYLQTR